MVFGGFFALLLLFRFSALPLRLALIGLPTSFVAHQLLDPYSDSDRSELDTEVIEATEATEAIEAIEEEQQQALPMQMRYRWPSGFPSHQEHLVEQKY